MTVRVHVCATIDASPAITWSAIEHIRSHVDWMADAEVIRITSATSQGVGTEFECDTRIGPLRVTDRMSITEWRPGEAMGVDHRGVVTGSGRFVLAPLAGGRTSFCWDERIRLPLWMGGPVGERAAAPLLTRLWQGNLGRLKRIVESTGNGAPPRRDPGAVVTSPPIQSGVRS